MTNEWKPEKKLSFLEELEKTKSPVEEAFREAIKGGIIPEVDKLSDDFMDKMVAKLKGKTLFDVMREKLGYSIDCCDEIVDAVESWLPKEQSAAGSQNVYVECTVEGFNDCLTKIKRKLR